MLIRCEHGFREKFIVEKGVHRFQSLLVTLSGEYEYSDGTEKRKILPFHPVLFKKGASFEKRILKPIEFLIVSPPHLHYEGGIFLSYAAEDTVRMKDSVCRLKNAVLENRSDRILEHYLEDLLLLAQGKEAVGNPMEAVYDYIGKNLAEKLELSLLAELAHCSVQTLIAGFKRHYGKTPQRVVAEHRVAKAKELLAGSSLSVGQIAERCGYENVYYFSNAFKKETGLSPRNYRQSALL